jgi:transposase
MMGRQTGNQSQLFYLFNLERRIPADHLLRRINPVVTRILVEVREQLAPFYSDIGRPSIDPELMIRMLIVGYCYGIRFERRLCEELELHLAYRWFCRLDLDDKVPDHSTFSVNRHGRFRDSDILRQVFEAVVRACMDAGLVKGEGFAVDASVMEANASRYRGKAPDEIAWAEPLCRPYPQRRKALGVACRAIGQDRVGHQSPDRPGAPPHRAADATRTRRRGDRMKRRAPLLPSDSNPNSETAKSLNAKALPRFFRGSWCLGRELALLGAAMRYEGGFTLRAH